MKNKLLFIRLTLESWWFASVGLIYTIMFHWDVAAVIFGIATILWHWNEFIQDEVLRHKQWQLKGTKIVYNLTQIRLDSVLAESDTPLNWSGEISKRFLFSKCEPII